MNLPPIKDGPLKTFSQCGERYDPDKWKENLLYTGPTEREEDEE